MSYALVLAVAWAALGGGAFLAGLASFAGELTNVSYGDNPAMKYLASPEHAFTMRSASLGVVGLSLGLFVWAYFLADRRWPFWKTGEKGEDQALAQAWKRGDWGFVGGRMKLALIRNPGDRNALGNLGVALWGLGRTEEAKLVFEKAVELGAAGKMSACMESMAGGGSPASVVKRPKGPIISAALGIPILIVSGYVGKLGGYVFRENALTHYDTTEFEVMYTDHFRVLYHDAA